MRYNVGLIASTWHQGQSEGLNIFSMPQLIVDLYEEKLLDKVPKKQCTDEPR